MAGTRPDRKTYKITSAGRARLCDEGIRHLALPAHPRSEIDLGIYVLPFLPRRAARGALATSISGLRVRIAFLEERLAWCRARQLWVPALAFERPLLALGAELAWLERVAVEFERQRVSPEEWRQYVYREPPGAAVGDPKTRMPRRSKQT